MSTGSSSSDPLGVAMPGAAALSSANESLDLTTSESGEEAALALYGPRGRATHTGRDTGAWAPLGPRLPPIAASPSRGHSRSGSAPPRREDSNPYAAAAAVAREPPGKLKRGTSRPKSADRAVDSGASSAYGSGAASLRPLRMFDVTAASALEDSPGAAADEEEQPNKKTKDDVPQSWSRLSLSEVEQGKNTLTLHPALTLVGADMQLPRDPQALNSAFVTAASVSKGIVIPSLGDMLGETVPDIKGGVKQLTDVVTDGAGIGAIGASTPGAKVGGQRP